MAALTAVAAMATVTIKPKKRSRMMISSCIAVSYCNKLKGVRRSGYWDEADITELQCAAALKASIFSFGTSVT
jgi:hypothetical protein